MLLLLCDILYIKKKKKKKTLTKGPFERIGSAWVCSAIWEGWESRQDVLATRPGRPAKTSVSYQQNSGRNAIYLTDKRTDEHQYPGD